MSIDRALSGLFRTIGEEAAQNPGFARRLEDSLAKFAEEHVARRKAESDVGDFHPLIEYRKDPEGFAKRLAAFDAPALRLIVKNHGLDNAGVLKPRAAKKALVEHVVEAARKRTERDAKLFEY
jgi:hypothetical protein